MKSALARQRPAPAFANAMRRFALRLSNISKEELRSGVSGPKIKRRLHSARLPATLLAVAACLFAGARPLEAGEVLVAVAANFIEPAREIAARFEKASPHKAILSFGSTGQFYAQIVQSAPFEVFLSADRATAAKAEQEGHAVVGSAFTYAVGRLALYSRRPGFVNGEATLRSDRFQRIAIANPATAPYGAASVEALKALNLYQALLPRIVQGNSIAQAFQFVDTGNAEIGFISLSQIARTRGGSHWVVPEALHRPIAQDAVLLKAGARNEAALAFLEFLKSAEARAIIERFGYGTAPRNHPR